MLNNAFGGWTLLRNALRKLDLNDTLYVIRAYAAFRTLRTKTPFPPDVEVHPAVYSDERLILPWEMEILAREAIIVCSRQPSTRYTARKWNTFSSLINKLRERGFDQAFGISFQDYVCQMLAKTFDGGAVTVYPEEPDTRPKRADWIIDQPTAFMLVECKTKRMTFGARTVIGDDDENELNAQLEVIGEAVVQTYQALEAHKNGEYRQQQYPYEPAKCPCICVVTLENWRLMGPQLEKLREIVKDKILHLGLDSGLTQLAPFVICSVNEMEEFAYLLKTNELTGVVRSYWDDPEKSSWAFISYLHQRYKNEHSSYTYVFSDELANVFTIQIDPQRRILSHRMGKRPLLRR
jgi:hypothetical protein